MNQTPPTPYRFSLRNEANHPILAMPQDGAELLKVLLDTGSPFTFRGAQGPTQATLLGRAVKLPPLPGRQGETAAGAAHLGCAFDVLMGLDLAGHLAWRLDWDAGVAEAAPALPEETGTHWVPMDGILPGLPGACPACEVTRQGARETALIDTGAQLSYRVGDLPQGAVAVGQTSDWNPHLGFFTTPIFEGMLEVGGAPLPVRYGQLPPMGDMMLRGMGASWVIGSDLLSAFRLTLDLPQGRLGLRARGNA